MPVYKEHHAEKLALDLATVQQIIDDHDGPGGKPNRNEAAIRAFLAFFMIITRRINELELAVERLQKSQREDRTRI